MGILQGSGDLVNVGNDALYRQRSARWMHLSQRTIGGIVHDKKGQVLLHVKIEDAHDMGMHETSNRARLRAEWFDVVARQVGMQHFDGHLRIEVQVLSQVDVGKTALSQQAQQVIVAQVLSHASGHPRTSSRELHFRDCVERSFLWPVEPLLLSHFERTWRISHSLSYEFANRYTI